MRLRAIAQTLAIVSLPAACVYGAVVPADEVVGQLPGGSARARVQVWRSFGSDGRFELRVDSRGGRLQAHPWHDWGPAQRASLYLAPEGWLAALGGGDTAIFVELADSAPPRLVGVEEARRTRSEKWIYLGVVDRDASSLRFFAPGQQQECVPLYAEGRIPYRREHQSRGNC